jgi:hypothetical protein
VTRPQLVAAFVYAAILWALLGALIATALGAIA